MEDSARVVAEAMHDWRMKQPHGEVEDAQLETMAKFREAEERLRFANHNLGDLHAEYKKMAQRKERLLTRIQKDMLATSTLLSSIKRKLAKHIREPTFSPLARRLSLPTTSSIAENEAAESDEADTAQRESASVGDTSITLNSRYIHEETPDEEEHESERLANPGEEVETVHGLSSTEEQLTPGVDDLEAQHHDDDMRVEPNIPVSPAPGDSSSTDSKDPKPAEISEENVEDEGDAVASTSSSADPELEIPTNTFAHLAVQHGTIDDSVKEVASGETRNVSPLKATQGIHESHMAPKDPTSSQHPEVEVLTRAAEKPEGDPEDGAQECPNPEEELCLKFQEVSADKDDHAVGE
eukprot:CAMPEP_0183829172 /NCGR_PEP_ID=MMETSP0807_2-20130328/3170_1 /TAXON_ID=88271 /ORGANISM="Picocystis salinarum, Strain CCMP1897" /LENGTH=352 /DNA_ID=CAMNT_0026074379 /DNA_START=88 /DNA_END=1146 /DNA_ORIENTATION=-